VSLTDAQKRMQGYVPCPKCSKLFLKGRHEMCRACAPKVRETRTKKISIKRRSGGLDGV
jgi:hypothetical protein